MTPGAVNRLRPLPWGGVGGGPFISPPRGRAQRPARYHRVVRAYFDNIAKECAR